MSRPRKKPRKAKAKPWPKPAVISNIIAIFVALVAVIGAIIAFGQWKISKKQLELLEERSDLVYLFDVSQTALTEEYFATEARNLAEEALDQIVEYHETHGGTYLEAIEATLPISKALRLSPSVVTIELRNDGEATANKVRLSIETDQRINDIKELGLEPIQTESGGIGFRNVKFLLPRLTAGDSKTIVLELEADTTAEDSNLMTVKGAMTNRLPTPGTLYAGILRPSDCLLNLDLSVAMAGATPGGLFAVTDQVAGKSTTRPISLNTSSGQYISADQSKWIACSTVSELESLPAGYDLIWVNIQLKSLPNLEIRLSSEEGMGNFAPTQIP